MKTTYMPRVIDAEYMKDYIINIVFSNGKTGKVDFQSFVGEGIFKPLQDVTFFQKFFVDGWTISWPNGADIAPETLYKLATN
jgi:hypothetical protein